MLKELDKVQLEQLKLVIKDWEHAFKQKHGRQPEKQDIKDNPEIAAKYKTYHGLKRGDFKKQEHVKPERALAVSTPPKRTKPSQAVSTTPVRGERPAHYDSPYSGNPASSQDSRRKRRRVLTVIGPTPQADGRVLGLFDIDPQPSPQMLPPSSPPLRNDLVTPTKQKAVVLTPVKSLGLQSPKSPTPSYFRPFNTDRIFMTPSPLKPQKVSRGLSTILAELKKAQDEAYNEEEQIMLEMEMQMDYSVTKAVAAPAAPTEAPGIAHVVETANKEGGEGNGEYHLGEVQEGDRETLIHESKERQTIMERVNYKKAKTQKRTTRRVILRPTMPGSVKTGQDELEQDLNSEEDIEKDDSATDEDEEKESNTDPLQKATKSAPTKMSKSVGGVSQNFKRLKLRNKGGRKFGGRRRR